MRLERLRAMPIHYLLYVVGLLVLLALVAFTVLHGQDIHHILHSAFFNRHGPVAIQGHDLDIAFFNRH